MGKFITMYKKKLLQLFITFFAFIFILFASSKISWAENLIQMAILPFDIHSQSNADYLREFIYSHLAEELTKAKDIKLIDKDIIARSIQGKTTNETTAKTVGKELETDYILMGSLTQIGEQISVDAKMIDIAQDNPPFTMFAEGRGLDSISSVASKLKAAITGRIKATKQIARIEFEGNRTIEDSAIKQVIRSTPGSFFSEATISSDIKAIYRMGHFSDVLADVKDTPEGKVITFILDERVQISEIKIAGNDAISTQDIEGTLTIKAKQNLNPENIRSDVQKIKALYDNKGYYNAEVSYALEKVGGKDSRVVIKIQENKRLYIRHIAFEGNEAYSDKELKEMMKTSEWGFFYFLTDSGLFKEDELKQDIGKINVFYLNNGFINARIGDAEVTHDAKWIYVKIPIVEGEKFRVGEVGITGDVLEVSHEELLKNLIIPRKEFYDREALMKDIDYLTQVCNNEGYAYADVTPRMIPIESNQTVEIFYHITKGSLVYFNRISILGNTKTRDKVIRRQLAFVEGDLFNTGKLRRSYMDLNRLRYFEEIDFQTEKGPEANLTDVNIRVKEKPTGIFSVGAGYSAVDHAIFTVQVSQENLFGRGQILSLKANISSSSSTYDLSFTEPWLFDIPLWSKFDIWNMNREYDTYDLDSKGFGITLGYPLWEYITGYVGYRLSTDNVQNIASWASIYTQEQAGSTTSSSLNLTLTRDTTDDYIFPSRGSKNSATIEKTGGPILMGDTSFTKYSITSSWFYPLPFEWVFGIRGRAGLIQENDGKKVPVYERYTLGGMNSLRGLRSVGYVDQLTGDVIGGLTMLNFNAEITIPLIKQAGIKGVLFYDTGNAWESGYHINDMRKTAGVGIRWYSPIGPLRLEWGHVLDKKEGEEGSRWEFTIGMFM
jgi:outer membrane protein insertion porin family